MTHLLSVSGEAMLFVAAFALQFLLMLAFRNPLQPKWLKWKGSDIVAALLMSSFLTIAFSFLMAGLVGTGLYFPYAIAIGVIFAIATPMLLWRMMKMRERLDACERGLSPTGFWDGALESQVDKAAAGPV